MPNGRSVESKRGYVLINVGKGHHLANKQGWAYEHRLVAEEILGRPLKKGEIVHHRDGNKSNNSRENIQITNGQPEHMKHHRRRTDKWHKGDPNPLVPCGCGCGELMHKFKRDGHLCNYINGHSRKNRIQKPTNSLIQCACGCGRWILKYDSKGNERKYMKGHPTLKVEKVCPECGNTFKIKPSHADKRIHCSVACMTIAYQKQMKGQGNPNYKDGRWIR
jgi:hypothetical protein